MDNHKREAFLNGTAPLLVSTNGVAVKITKPSDWLQFIDGADARRGPVTMRLVHQHYQVGQTREVIEITLPDVFREPFDAWRTAAAHFGIDLGNVENVDANSCQFREATGSLIIIVTCDDFRRVRRELRDALKDILRRVRRKICNQLVVNRQVRREDEEIIDALRQMQVGDKRAHEPRFANASCQRKADGWKLALKIRHRWEFGFYDCERGGGVRRFAGRHDLRDAVEDFQRFMLRRAQTQPASNGVDVPIHRLPSGMLKKSCCPGLGGALGRFSIFKL